MRKQLALTAATAVGLHLALAPPALSAAPLGDPTAQPACSVSGAVPDGGGPFHLSTSDCAYEPVAREVGFVGRAMAFLFGPFEPSAVPVPAAAPGRLELPAPRTAPVASTGLRCSVDVAEAPGNRRAVGIALISQRPMRVSGKFEVTVSGNGTQRFSQRIDEPVEVARGEDAVVVLASTNLGRGAMLSGAVLTEKGERIECDAAK